MKDARQCQNKLNDLIRYANAETDDDHKGLGAMLVSAGAAFMDKGGATPDEIAWCFEQGRRAQRGERPLPPPGSDRMRKCDGDHPAPRCPDPQCWRDDEPIV